MTGATGTCISYVTAACCYCNANSLRPVILSPCVRSRFSQQAALAASVQADLEESALALLGSLRQRTGQRNLCLAGGVALNSVLNGRVAREAGFDAVHVSAAPGDEGVALGCALYGLEVGSTRSRRLIVDNLSAPSLPCSAGVTA